MVSIPYPKYSVDVFLCVSLQVVNSSFKPDQGVSKKTLFLPKSHVATKRLIEKINGQTN